MREPGGGVDLVGLRSVFFAISGVVILISVVLLAIPPTLVPGIEFTAGTTALIRFDAPVTQSELRAVYDDLGHPEARIQSTGDGEYLIRTSELEVPPGSFSEVAPDPGEEIVPIGPSEAPEIGTVELGAEDLEAGTEVLLRKPSFGDNCVFGGVAARHPAGTVATIVENLVCAEGITFRVLVGEDVGLIREADTHNFTPPPAPEPEPPVTQGAGERTDIETRLFEEFGNFEVLEFASVSAVVSRVAVRNATIAVVVASLFIMAYVAFAFSSVPSPFRYATCAIIALIHDVVIVLGAFSLFGKLFGLEINLMFVTGLLTVIGFSVHDSIVVFDRIRENVSGSPNAPLGENVNAALVQTMSRSLNTSLTLLVTVAALLTLGGVTIQAFLLVILVGVIAGTYSSIAIAAQLLVAWEEGDIGRLFRGRRREASETA
jgi:preprotein translocase subunit SecF